MVIENLKKVEDKITAACLRAGRAREDVTLIAVSKTKPESITTEQAAEIARLAEALKQSAKAIRTEE